jgi:hypothetical protein
VVLPLATLLFTAASVVYLRARLGRHRRLGRWLQAGTVAVAAGLLVRGAAGVIWVTGTGVHGGTPFYWLNLLLYTPVCLAGGAATVAVARRGH